jgi:hypothetical protein
MEQFSKLSISINKDIPKKTKQQQGIFFTPKNARDKIFNFLQTLDFNPSSILEPSFGSGEFIIDSQKFYPDADIEGVELNEEIFNKTVDILPSKTVLINDDFLNYSSNPVDLIIGNPPYFVTKIKNHSCMSGRGNIFVLFIYKCLTEHLNEGGILAFVLPTSFYNCSYYEPCRKFISENTTILHVENLCDDVNYLDTSQTTMIMILKKEFPVNDNYIFRRGGNIYISPFYEQLNTLVEDSYTLRGLGFNVKTGDVVWNQHKEKLSDSGDLLIYSSNIVNNELVFGNEVCFLSGEKKQYISGFQKELTKGPAILIPRGYGNSYNFQYAVVQKGVLFYGENHVNIIYGQPNTKIRKIEKSFNSEKTIEFIKMFVGNGALSKTELLTVLPIWIK